MGYSIRFDVTAHDLASRVFREVGREAEYMAVKVAAADAAMDKMVGSNRAQMWTYGIVAALTALPPVLNGAIVAAGGLESALVGAASGAGILGLALFGSYQKVAQAAKNHDKLKGVLGQEVKAYTSVTSAYKGYINATKGDTSPILINGFHMVAFVLNSLAPTLHVFANTFQKDFAGPIEYAVEHGGLAGFLMWSRKVGRVDFKYVLDILKNLGGTVLNLAYAFSGPGKGILKWLDEGSRKMEQWAQNLGGSSGFHQFLNYVKQNGPVVINSLFNLVKALGHLAEASAPYSKYMWQGIDMLARVLAKMPSDVLFAMAAGMTALNLAAKGAVLVKAFGSAMIFLDAAMDANPIGLVVTAIGLLIVIFEECMLHSKKFRDVLGTVWKDIKAGAMAVLHWFQGPFVSFFTQTIPDTFHKAIAWITSKWLGFIGFFVNASAKLFGWVPVLGSKLKTAANNFDQFKDRVNRSLGGIHDKTISITAKASVAGSVGGQYTVQYHPKGGGGGGKYAGGGYITGPGTGTSDSIPAWLSNGEYVMPARQTKRHLAKLEAMRRGYADGGLVGADVNLASATSGIAKIVASIKQANTNLAKWMKSHIQFMYTIPAAIGGGPTSASVRGYEAFAFAQFPRYGWGASQRSPLVALWNRESGWNPHARNPSSGAYGIPQALPASKIPGGYNSTAAEQILWGLGYIRSRYGSPGAAWGHEVSAGWYDQGGIAGWGPGWMRKETKRPERVLSPRQTIAFERLVDHLANSPDFGKIMKRVADRLDAATKKLDDLLKARQQMATQIRQGIVQSGDITAVGAPADGSRITAYSILSGMQGALTNATQFKNRLAQLRKMGLSTALYRQFVNAGVSSLPTVSALLEGGKADVLKANHLQSALVGVGQQFGQHAAHILMSQQITAQRETVKELRILNRALEREQKRHQHFQGMFQSPLNHGAGSHPGGIHIHVHASGVADPVKIGKEVQKALLALKRTNGGKKLGLA